MNPHLWYNRQGQPISTEQANTLLGDPAYKRVGLTHVTSSSDPGIDYQISTVWLGVNHNYVDDGAPIIFETMVFGFDGADQYMQRYATEDQARAGHTETVTVVAATVADEVVTELDDWPKGESDASEPATTGPHIHKWGEWEDAVATYGSPLLPWLGKWKGPVQVRRCSRCNKAETRKVT